MGRGLWGGGVISGALGAILGQGGVLKEQWKVGGKGGGDFEGFCGDFGGGIGVWGQMGRGKEGGRGERGGWRDVEEV